MQRRRHNKRLQELGCFGFCGSNSLASRGVLSRVDLNGGGLIFHNLQHDLKKAYYSVHT